MTPATVNDIVLPVFILENKLINGLSTVVKLINKRFADMVFIWSFWFVCYGYAYAAGFAVTLYVIGTKKKDNIFLSFLQWLAPT